MAEFRVAVFGTPAPQGSKRFYGSSAGGKGRFVEDGKNIKSWRAAVHDAAQAAIRCCNDPDCRTLRHPFPLTGPLVVRMVFSFVRPKSHYRSGKNAHLLRDDAPARPTGRPDVSKTLRSSEDSLTDAGVIKDDALLVEYERAAKVWCGEDPEALDAPGALIVVRTLVDVLNPTLPPPLVDPSRLA